MGLWQIYEHSRRQFQCNQGTATFVYIPVGIHVRTTLCYNIREQYPCYTSAGLFVRTFDYMSPHPGTIPLLYNPGTVCAYVQLHVATPGNNTIVIQALDCLCVRTTTCFDIREPGNNAFVIQGLDCLCVRTTTSYDVRE